jgi:iron complex transport system substrate-binding protein
VTLERLQDYPRDIRLMGRLLDREQRAEKLAVYAEQSLSQILPQAAAIPETERVRVYYALGRDGLRTDGGGTWHAELIDLAGGFNVHQGDPEDLFGMQQISLEQVMLYQPEVILAQDTEFYKRVFTSPGWRNIPAVKNGRVYLIPSIPFNWFDRPPPSCACWD